MVSPTEPVGDEPLQMDESEDGGAIPIGFGVDSSSQLVTSCVPPTGAPSSGWAWSRRDEGKSNLSAAVGLGAPGRGTGLGAGAAMAVEARGADHLLVGAADYDRLRRSC
jgi:hypothetical protein